MTLNEEKLWNRYLVQSELGRGRFGTALLVKDLDYLKFEGDELKVVKKLETARLDNDEKTFKEAELLAKLRHRHIVSYYGSFSDANLFYIVIEYCDGGDLKSKISEKRSSNADGFDQANVITWLAQLMSAVEYLHAKNIIHRDISPGNILLKVGELKLGDFGVSKMLKSRCDVAETFAGTPLYMSPEALNLQTYDSKADIWSCGCILYELCTLKTLFTVQGIISLSVEVATKEIPPLPPSFLPALNTLFLHMVGKNPSSRASAAWCSTILQEMKTPTSDQSSHPLSQQLSSPVAQSSSSSTAESAPRVNLVDTETQLWFQAIDVGNNGVITTDELQAALFQNGGQFFGSNTIREFFNLFDIDKNLSIDLNEFAGIFDFIRQRRNEFERVRDKDDDGTIDYYALEFLLAQNLAYQLSLPLVQLFSKQFGLNGRVSFDTYLLTSAFLKARNEEYLKGDCISQTFSQFVTEFLSK